MDSEQVIDAAVQQISGGKVLDVATGAGSMVQWMADDLKDWDEITGIDMIDINQRLSDTTDSIFQRDHIRFVQMDAHHLDFPDAFFDTVTISYSMHHMADPEQVLREIDRVLKPGGHFIMAEMVRDNLTGPQLTHMYLHHWWAGIDRALGVTHNETFTRQALVDMVQAMDLHDVDFYDYTDLDADPHDPDTIARMHGHIQRYIERARDLPDFETIRQRGEELAQRLDTIGWLGATGLYAIGQK